MADPRRAWLTKHGYMARTLKRDGHVIAYDEDVACLLDHAFSARHVMTGIRVLFGDPYFPDDSTIKRVEDEYGLDIRRHRGLHYPGQTTLLEFRIADPRRARKLFDYEVRVGRPADYLGMTLRKARSLK